MVKRLVFLTGLMFALVAGAFAQDRSAEIWSHVESRVAREIDQSFEDGDFPFVIDMIKVQFAYEPGNFDTLTNLGWMLENVERYDEAEDLYKTFRSTYPKNPEAAYPLGFFYYMRKRYDESIAILRPTLELGVTPHANTYRTLAKSYERQKKYAQAIDIWEKQLKAYPSDAPVRVNIDRVKKKMATGGK